MRHVRTILFMGALGFGVLGLALPSGVVAQGDPEVRSAESWPEAAPEDVASIDAIVAALYDVISGPAGQSRNWDRFRSLFVPGARLIPTGIGETGAVGHRIMTPDEYASSSGPFLEERGFFETETARTSERFGQIAHAFSTYDSRWSETDEEPFARGINSIQLLHDGERWSIVNIFWAAERPDLPLPERYKTSRR